MFVPCVRSLVVDEKVAPLAATYLMPLLKVKLLDVGSSNCCGEDDFLADLLAFILFP